MSSIAESPTPTHGDGAGSVGGSARERDVRVLIVGSGFAGLGAAIRLRQEGVEDFVVLERAGDLGGTWRDNHYPGCCCDVPSHLYSFSFALSRRWTRGFAPQQEIYRYLRQTAERFDVLPHIRFGEEMLEARWDEQIKRWRVLTSTGKFTARILVSAAGALSEPMIPDLPGLDAFRGAKFHSADWDHEHDLSGERVAVIGTGASAIQFVPAIQPDVEQIHLFQRTPPWVIPRLDHQITNVEHRLLRWIPFAPAIVRGAIYALLEIRVLGFRNPKLMKIAEWVSRWHLKRNVSDPELRRRLLPNYTIGCKRILVSDDYFPALAKPNVDVISEAVKEIRAHSIVDSDGHERPVDTIIFGTGFHVTDFPVGGRIHGRDGRSLTEVWEGSIHAYLGTAVPGFPNLFLLAGPNTGIGHTSMVYMIESQLNYLLDALRVMQSRRLASVEVRPEVEAKFNDTVQAATEGTVWTAGNCKSWYLDDTGRNTTLWPRFTFEFRRRTRRFDPDAYVLTSAANGALAEPTPPASGAAFTGDAAHHSRAQG